MTDPAQFLFAQPVTHDVDFVLIEKLDSDPSRDSAVECRERLDGIVNLDHRSDA